MRHLYWIGALLVAIVATQVAWHFHGDPGLWFMAGVLSAYGVLYYLWGYADCQRKIDKALEAEFESLEGRMIQAGAQFLGRMPRPFRCHGRKP